MTKTVRSSRKENEYAILERNVQKHLECLESGEVINTVARSLLNSFPVKEPHRSSIKTTPASDIQNAALELYFVKSKKADLQRIKLGIEEMNTKILQELQAKEEINKKYIHEINWVTEEKIDGFNEKDKLEQQMEKCRSLESNSYLHMSTLNFSSAGGSLPLPTERNTKLSQPSIPMTSRESEKDLKKEKEKKIKELKNQLAILEKSLSESKKNADEINKKNQFYIKENKNLLENIKQKQIILDQVKTDISELKIILDQTNGNHKQVQNNKTKSTTTRSSVVSNSNSNLNLNSNEGKESKGGVVGFFKGLFKK